MAHYVVPLFQRPYSWRQKDWSTLWSDVVETYEQNPPGLAMDQPHFLGAVVSKAAGSTLGGVSAFLLIDGQQRLTTLTLLLAALRDAAKERRPQLAEKIQEVYLTNRYASPLDHLERVIVSGIEVVSITLGDAENEYRIFESLNGKGEPPVAD